MSTRLRCASTRTLSASSPSSTRPTTARSSPRSTHRAVAGIRDIDAVGKGGIGDALWLPQAGNSAQHLAGCQIDHPQTVVAELGNEQPLTLRIDAEVINAAAHLTDRDLRLHDDRRPGR